ncbi:MAG TPA: tetratricopeptide repeat protein, partial [Nitrospirae bacterium]|nr:tetratricopeptide repeat protein [Nitrospirota bacterium]
MNKNVLIAIACFVLLNACGGGQAPARMVSEQVDRSTSHNVKARAAFERGDWALAMKFSSEALRLSRSVEDIVGTATNLVNIAAIYRARGDSDSAHETLRELFNPVGIEYPEGMLVRGAILKALLYIDSGDLDAASKWADKAEALCKSSRCQSISGVYNLKGRVLLLRDKVTESLKYARKGFGSSGGSGAESGNSLRLMADAYMALKEHAQAEKFYGQTLELDKKLGLPSKIALDLLGMGKASIGAGNHENARQYLLRALDVSKSSSVRAQGPSEETQEDINVLLKTLEPAEEPKPFRAYLRDSVTLSLKSS